jgi:hypothetical protein
MSGTSQDIENAITVILSKADPIRLRVMGAPEDEYSQEARIIAQRLSQCGNQKDIEELVMETFVALFDKKLASQGAAKLLEASNQIWTTVAPMIQSS